MVLDKHVSSIMLRLQVSVANAWMRTVIDISRMPKLHSLVITAIPPYMSWICEDHREVCELYMYNLAEELENLGLTPVFKINGKHYEAEIYETIKL